LISNDVAPYRILIVDSDAEFRMMLVNYLEEQNMRVRSSANDEILRQFAAAHRTSFFSTCGLTMRTGSICCAISDPGPTSRSLS
jgi:PleD family two-component response regulator